MLYYVSRDSVVSIVPGRN